MFCTCLFLFSIKPLFLTKSLIFCKERIAKAGCSAFLHCWHSILVASFPCVMWFLKHLISAAISVGDLLFWFPSGILLFSRIFRNDYKREKQIPRINTMITRSHLSLLDFPNSQIIIFNLATYIYMRSRHVDVSAILERSTCQMLLTSLTVW